MAAVGDGVSAVPGVGSSTVPTTEVTAPGSSCVTESRAVWPCTAVARFRHGKNTFSWGTLIPVLKDLGDVHVVLCKKNPVAFLQQTLATTVGFVFYFDSFMSCDLELVRKEINDILASLSPSDLHRIILCAGGAHPTACPADTLDLGFHIAGRGEGEHVIGEIVKVVTKGAPWESIPGIAFKSVSTSQIVYTPSPPLIPRLDDYISFCEEPALHPPIEIMRGCPFACRYCQTSGLHGGTIRYRSIASIEKIIQHYVSRYPSPVDIRFITPNSLGYMSEDGRTPNIDKLKELVSTVKKYPVNMYLGSFPSEVRPEFVTPETVAILAQSATKVVAVGGQSGSDEVLQRMHRCHTSATIRNACSLLLGAGLLPQVDFILGSPEETENQQFMTLAFINELVTMGCHIRMHYFMPLPGTPWANKMPAPLSSAVASEVGKLLRSSAVEGAFGHQVEVSAATTTPTESKKKTKPSKSTTNSSH
ncbi:B12-binding domain/radical SAM domain protein [Pelomyxa schiedti]|nr:B12-binding domain/radical SAM domain protein [Pelomyxa schiedti]